MPESSQKNVRQLPVSLADAFDNSRCGNRRAGGDDYRGGHRILSK